MTCHSDLLPIKTALLAAEYFAMDLDYLKFMDRMDEEGTDPNLAALYWYCLNYYRQLSKGATKCLDTNSSNTS